MITEIEKYIIKSLITSPKNDKEIGYNSALIMLLKSMSTSEHVDMEATFNANNTDESTSSLDSVMILRIKKRNALREEIRKIDVDFGDDVGTLKLDKIIDFVEGSSKLLAVKYLKEISRFGLKEAKYCIDVLDTIH